jgi:DNA-binding transcriptional MocR family regulator
MTHSIIDLSRAVPPIIPELEASIPTKMKHRMELAGAGGLLRTNRPRGTEEDRHAGASWLSQRLGYVPGIERMVVTNGTLNALFLLLSQLVGKGGTLLTEEMTYPNMQALSGILGFDIRGIPTDRMGLEPNAFEDACRRCPGAKVLYTIPTFQNPTATVMPLQRRKEICEIARRCGVLIIEDDAQSLMLEHGPPPLATLAPELTWYVMGMAKTVVMGLRVAFLLAPNATDIDQLMTRFGKMSMWFVAAFQAELAQAIIMDGSAHQATRSIRVKASRRRQIVADLLDRRDLLKGPQGLHVWLPTDRDASDLAEAALAAGVLIRPGIQFAAQPRATDAMSGLRLSFCEVGSEGELRKGLTVIAGLLR